MGLLYAKLARAGFTRKYVREILLPEWWDDGAAAVPAGFAEALLAISRHTGLDYESLASPQREPTFADAGLVRFKRAQTAAEDELRLASSVALRAAALAVVGVRDRAFSRPASAGALRAEILAGGAPWVSLETLLDACWDAGIPVLHLSRLPQKAKKMDGMVASVEGRPVIVVARNEGATAWLLFIVAHELGHIALGHVDENGSIMDLSVQRPDDASEDDEERDANRFAIELLCGGPICFGAESRWPNAVALARWARTMGERHAIDPGHLALNFGHTMNLFPLARAALKRIEPEADAPALIRTKMIERLDWSALPSDSARFLARLCGVTDDPEA